VPFVEVFPTLSRGGACGAESKDPGGAYLVEAVRSFSTTEARPTRSFPRAEQRKGWRREKKLNLIRTINPEFKDLAQTWGWKIITVHEKMYP
jgi:hypothetical protein